MVLSIHKHKTDITNKSLAKRLIDFSWLKMRKYENSTVLYELLKNTCSNSPNNFKKNM